jgi:hypothetical protein
MRWRRAESWIDSFIRRAPEGQKGDSMIRYGLVCVGEHEFEAWFSSSEVYDRQRKRGDVECPVCGSRKVRKQIAAPAVHGASDTPRPPRGREAEAAWFAGEVRRRIAETHEYVGDRFAEEARAMHAGESEHKPVWGEVTPETARELIEEGVPALPLPKPFAPDPPRKRSRLN